MVLPVPTYQSPTPAPAFADPSPGCTVQELPGLKAHDHQAAELLHHTINGLRYASPRSLVITLQHFCRVRDAVTARQQQQQHGSNGGSSGGCRQLPTPTWQVDAVVNGQDEGAAPDLSSLQGTMQASLVCVVVSLNFD
jgi:hypothetical protein